MTGLSKINDHPATPTASAEWLYFAAANSYYGSVFRAIQIFRIITSPQKVQLRFDLLLKLSTTLLHERTKHQSYKAC